MRSIVGFIVFTVALAATLTLGQDTIHGSLFKLDPFALESKLSQAAGFAHYDSANGHQLGKDSDKNCAMCSLGLGVLEQYAQTHSLSLATAANNWCAFATSDFPTLTGLCQLFISGSIAKLQADFANGVSPDVSCRTTLTSCSSASTCTLFQQWPVPSHSKRQRVGVPEDVDQDPTHRHYAETLAKLINVQAVDEEKVIEKLNELSRSGAMSAELKKKLGNLKGKWLPVPIPDSDGDLYGATFTYRGIQYRGQDCNDQDATVYPGKSVGADADAKVDSNCNGIYGVDPNSQIPWEDALCSQYPSRGILAIGDSATAHFSLPPSFVTPEGFNMSTYHGLIQDLFTEIDWPHCSWSTAWANSTVCPYSSLEITSIYQKMLERNRCMHRDYVNAGVNGASVNNIIDDGPIVPSNYTGALQALPSRYKVDGPSTVFFSMIGNDICHAKELGGWTPLDVFNQKVLEEFAYLDTILAPKSHVIIMGVVDGRVLFDTLKDKHHPIGPTYTQFYDYLNCLKMSPCWGWMNSNQTVRDASSQRAADYNAVYGEIIATATFQNFDLHYFYPDYAAIIAKWTAQGGDPAQLIEPVDGFHPSQTGNILIAEAMWEFITQNVPDAMGVENPNNAEIIAQFGNQGGYGL